MFSFMAFEIKFSVSFMVDKNVPTEPSLQPLSEKEIKQTFGNKIKNIKGSL